MMATTVTFYGGLNMAQKYCKKSSVKSVADEVKVRQGSSNSIQGSGLASAINNLVLPTQRGAPNTVLTASSPSKTIQRGEYTGGSVYVTPQSKTATLTVNGSTINADANKVLSSVTVPAKNTATFAYGNITPSSGATSISVSGLSFKPIGFAIFPTASGSWTTYTPQFMLGMFTADGVKVGVTGSNKSGTMYYGVINGASVTFGNSSVSISNITAKLNGTAVNATFQAKQFTWVCWG